MRAYLTCYNLRTRERITEWSLDSEEFYKDLLPICFKNGYHVDVWSFHLLSITTNDRYYTIEIEEEKYHELKEKMKYDE